MTDLRTLQDLARLYAERGGLHYGEGVTQLEHALQCAILAQEEGSSANLIAAALLHDVGHLLLEEDHVTQTDRDDRHEILGARVLSGLFDNAVRAPIALHVAAKRYLCFKDTQYFQALSPASQRSLALQGGPFDAEQAMQFENRPYWREAVALRRFDDTGKRDGLSSRSFDTFLPLLHNLSMVREP